MKQQENERRTERVDAHLTPSELAALTELFRSSTHREFAIFIRALLFRKPLIKKVRDQSLDDILVTLLGIKNELEIACRSFTAAELIQRTTEIKALLIKIYEECSRISRP